MWHLQQVLAAPAQIQMHCIVVLVVPCTVHQLQSIAGLADGQSLSQGKISAPVVESQLLVGSLRDFHVECDEQVVQLSVIIASVANLAI